MIMFNFPTRTRTGGTRNGFSLLELLMVLATLAVLGIVGVSMLGNRSSSSVRAVMDELEGTLMAAQKLAVSTGQDVTIATQGNWDPETPLFLADGVRMTPTAVIANALNSAAAFRLAVITTDHGASLARDHRYAGVVAATGTGATWWGDAMAADPASRRANDDLATEEPFATQTGFTGILGTPADNLFQGGTDPPPRAVTVSGSSKRFNATFWIEVVALREGGAVKGGAMGLLAVQANGATVYKFYNPGVINGNGKWRRI